MIIELKVPELGESISEVQVGAWLAQVGQMVDKDEVVVEIESEKATVEVSAPERGVLVERVLPNGASAKVGELLGRLDTEAKPTVTKIPETPAAEKLTLKSVKEAVLEDRVMPSAQRVLAQQGVSSKQVQGTGPGQRVLKEDAVRLGSAGRKKTKSREERTEKMTQLRKTIASRLVEAKQTTALLTTFNEVDMSGVMRLRKEVQDAFKEKHGVKLGFMSFFVKAVCQALSEIPKVGSQIRGDDMVTFDYCDVGIAVGGGKGLVVPVLRNAETMGFAEVEQTIADMAAKAKSGKLSMDDLRGGTFTISNGGIYGSMLSTPIINPPQSAILGLHAINDRPVAVDGQVVIRPMMYLALSYDHRIVDGREAVMFLIAIKKRIENPALMMMELLEE